MEVTEVARVRGKICLVVGGERILITKSLYEERPLQVGDEVDLEEYDQFLLLHQYRPALEYAVSLLASRPHSSGEIESHLRRIGYRPQTIEMVLFKLSQNDLLNDAAFARQWAEAKAGMKLGKARIAYDLRRKGISSDDIQEALEGLDEDDLLESAKEIAVRAWRKAKAGEDVRKTRQRVLGALVRRGFSYDLAKDAIEYAENDENS